MLSTLKKKESIPNNIKRTVWEKYRIYPCYPEITQCRTCDNLVLMPESIRQYYNTTYNIQDISVNGKITKINGVAEFGHIISEKNGGKATEDNLLIQCKACNLRQMTNNILPSRLITDYIMLDVTDNFNVKMGENCDTCQKILGSGSKCKNKAIFNRRFCHIHLTS
jgi:hypothetical protein